MLSNELLSQISDALVKSETNRIPIDPITTTYPAVEISDAYQIQMMVVAKKARAGARSIGKKIGLTSEAMRAQLGVGEPDFGTLTDRMVHFDGDDIRIEQLIQPRVEAEVAFLLGKELRGPGVTPLSVMRSTEALRDFIARSQSR